MPTDKKVYTVLDSGQKQVNKGGGQNNGDHLRKFCGVGNSLYPNSEGRKPLTILISTCIFTFLCPYLTFIELYTLIVLFDNIVIPQK